MKPIIKEDLFELLDTIEDSVNSSYTSREYLEECFNEYLRIFNNEYRDSDKEDVIDYLINVYLKEDPDYAIVLFIMPKCTTNRYFRRFAEEIDKTYRDLSLGYLKELENFKVSENVFAYIQNEMHTMIDEDFSIEEHLLKVIASFPDDFELTLFDQDMFEYIFKNSPKFMGNTITEVIDVINSLSTIVDPYNYLQGNGVPADYLLDLVMSVYDNCNKFIRDSLSTIRYTKIFDIFGRDEKIFNDLEYISTRHGFSKSQETIFAIILCVIYEVISINVEQYQVENDGDMTHLYTYVNLYINIRGAILDN